VLACAGAACPWLTLGSPSLAQGQIGDQHGALAAESGLPEVHRQGGDLVAAGRRFRAWGFKYGLGSRYPILSYFDRPTQSRLRDVVADMREARSLGANTLRVYLELEAFMNGPNQPNRRALAALSALRRGRAPARLPRPDRQPRVARPARLVRRPPGTGSLGGAGALLAGGRTHGTDVAGGARLRAHERARDR
jgi:hypothetical protein